MSKPSTKRRRRVELTLDDKIKLIKDSTGLPKFITMITINENNNSLYVLSRYLRGDNPG